MMDLSAVVCIDINGGIGKNGQMPWGNALKKDLQRFRNLTWNSTVIMGRKTFESLPHPLYGRRNIVIGRGYCTLNAAIDMIKRETGRAYVIGGQSVYEQLLPYCNKIYMTEIKGVFDCDRCFPLVPELDMDWDLKYWETMKDGEYITEYTIWEREKQQEAKNETGTQDL